MDSDTHNDNIGHILNHASKLMADSQYSDAINELELGVSIDPNNKSIWERVVICNLELKRPKKAIEALNRILTFEPQAGNIWADKAYLHLLLNERNEGILALQESLKLQPRNKKDWEMLAIALMGAEQWVDAETALQNALHLNPNAALIWYSLAACKFVLGDHQTGVACANHALSIDPSIGSLIDDMEEFLEDDDEDDDLENAWSTIVAG
ncbi:MAG: tetratricopeptide repeat protein [Candidatus Thorarchaeota archaeon]